jgi:hypothetical protein
VSRRRIVAVACVVLGVAGCSTGKPQAHTAAPGPTGTVTTPTTTPSSSSVSTPTTSTGASTSAAASTTPPVLPADYCKASQLQLMLLPGGAIQGYEIAAVTFTNTSSKSCSLSGYPTVELRRGAQLLATATPHGGTTPTLIHLKPAAQAQAQIRDHSTCQAPLSDTVHFAAPAPLGALQGDRPFQLRGCTVTVEPIALSS